MSRAPGVYKPSDILIARRIARSVRAVPVARARASKRRSARTKRPRARRSSSRACGALTDELDARTGYRRVDRRIGVMARGADAGDAGGGDRDDRAAARRVGHRQGSGRALPAPRVGARRAVRSSRSTARRCPSTCSRRSCSATSAARSPARRRASRGSSSRPAAARCSSTKSARWRRRRRPNSCACCRNASSSASAARACCAPTRASSPRPTAICSGRWSRATFREDLFYRLNVFAIRLPPLRDRRDDIAAAERGVPRRVRPRRSGGRPPASRATRGRRLMEYHWPGNVRELRNILERAAILCDGGLITAEHLALTLAPRPRHRRRRRRNRRRIDRRRPPRRRPAAAGDLQSMERDDDRAGASERAVQQVEGGAGARPDARPALRAHEATRFGVT